jgi:3-oxoacyl-[acyl-carrier protein] reductase
MAFELAPHNIIVNAVSPGPIMTEFNAERVNANPALKARRMSYIRAGRYGRAEEVAEVVAFLASSKGTYMLGENIVIDGGYVVH